MTAERRALIGRGNLAAMSSAKIMLILCLAIVCWSARIDAGQVDDAKIGSQQILSELAKSPQDVINRHVREGYRFAGLASYYNNINYFIVDDAGIRRAEENEKFELAEDQWLAIVGRFDVLSIMAAGLEVVIDTTGPRFDDIGPLARTSSSLELSAKHELIRVDPRLDQIRYAHLWSIFAWLASLTEWTLVLIQANISSNWGVSIILFTILLRIIVFPVSLMTVRFQRKVSQIRAQLEPDLEAIKANYKGEEAHVRIISAHKKLGVTPFYSLKPLLGAMVQVPILVGIFNALGEMPQFEGQAFLWIADLAYPDAILQLPFGIPLMGDKLSLLPVLMAAVVFISTFIYDNRYAPVAEIRRQKRNLVLMGIAFFFLFYPFPAAMVLFWVAANVLQTIQQQIMDR